MNIQRGIKISQYTKFYYALFTVEGSNIEAKHKTRCVFFLNFHRTKLDGI